MNTEKFYTNIRERILPSFLPISFWLSLYCTLVLAFWKPFQLLIETKWFDAINVRFLKQNIKNKRIIISLHFYFLAYFRHFILYFKFKNMSNKFKWSIRMPLHMKHSQNCFWDLDCSNVAFSNMDKAWKWKLFMLLKYSAVCFLHFSVVWWEWGQGKSKSCVRTPTSWLWHIFMGMVDTEFFPFDNLLPSQHFFACSTFQLFSFYLNTLGREQGLILEWPDNRTI